MSFSWIYFEFILITAVASAVFCTRYVFFIIFGYYSLRVLLSDIGRRCIKTLPRDLKGIKLLINIQLDMRKCFKINRPIHEHFLNVIKRHPHKDCIIEVETGRSLTFEEFNKHSNKYANFFSSLNYKKDDVVAIFLENGIEFFASWFGLSKIGIISAWINTNLKLETLAHSIKVSSCKAIITSSKLLPKIKDAMSANLLDKDFQIFLVDLTDLTDIKYESLLNKLKDSSEPPFIKQLTLQSILCYIYTSGTTGNPKAAIIRHYRYFVIGVGSKHAFEISSSDRIYITLPMYHSAGGILGIGQVITTGATAVIRTKFSARNFWQDCITYNCTATQYIGEICRYLLAQDPSEYETKHKIRLMYGNGLRPEIWSVFVKRFCVKKIGELYGSTEGNSNILNINNHEGSCGFMPIYPLLHKMGIYPIRLIKIDEKTGKIIRNPKTGLCVACKPGETGEIVGTIRLDDPMLRFEGYVNSDDTQKKIIRDVIKKGDYVFSSGDILYWDKLGYLYFKDRCGDTFRWKGENCATTEVEGVVQSIMNIVDATVYGVQIPHCEGRAGMMSVALTKNTEIHEFLENVAIKLSNNLASYAIPVFLRICKEVDRTGTFKLKKNKLQNDGYDLSKCENDSIYIWNSIKKRYTMFNHNLQKEIDEGTYTRF